MAFLSNDDQASGTGVTTTGSGFEEQTGAEAGLDLLFVVLAHSADPGTIVPPTSWGDVTQFQTDDTGCFLTTIVAEDVSASEGVGTVHTFTWDNAVSFVGTLDGVQSAAPWFFVTSPTLEGTDVGAGGPSNWLLTDRTFNFSEVAASAPLGVHVISPRAYLRTAGSGAFSSFADTGNGTYTGGFSVGSGLLGVSLNQFVRTNEASLTTGARGLTWADTASGVGVQQVVKIGFLSDEPATPNISPDYFSNYERRSVSAKALPYRLDSSLLRGVFDE